MNTKRALPKPFWHFLRGGYVYRGRKAVYWCISCKTALAEAEVEYENDRSPSIYVRYPVTSDPAALDPALAGRKLWVIIWTTTPWTLPASMAVAFHPDFEYVVVGDDDPHGDAYIIESRRLGPVVEATGLNAPNILARIPAKALEKIRDSPSLSRPRHRAGDGELCDRRGWHGHRPHRSRPRARGLP